MARSLRIALLSGNSDVMFGRLQLIESQSDLEVVYTESNGITAFEKVPELAVDVILIDHRLKGLDGIELTRLLNESYLEAQEQPPAIVLTGPYFSSALQISCIRAGAVDLVTQDAGPQVLLDSIRAAGDRLAEPKATELLALFEAERIAVEVNLDTESAFEDLPERALAILRGFLRGKTDDQLAAELDTPKYRIRQQFNQILASFGCTTRSQLCLVLFEAGLVDV